jgi:hypothetical protein
VSDLPSAHLEDGLDFDGNVIWQRTHPDRHAGVAPGFSEHFHEQVGGAVDDLGMGKESRLRIDEPGHPDAADYPVQVSIQGFSELSHQVEGAEPGCLLPLSDSEFPTQLTDEAPLSIPL